MECIRAAADRYAEILNRLLLRRDLLQLSSSVTLKEQMQWQVITAPILLLSEQVRSAAPLHKRRSQQVILF